MRARATKRRGAKGRTISAKRKTARKAARKMVRKTARTRPVKARARKTAKSPARKLARKKTARKQTLPTPRKAVARSSRARQKSPRPAAKEVFGEGNYTASREFRREQTEFVKRNKSRIPSLGRAAEAALDGEEHDALDAAAERARSHSHAPGEEM